MPKENKAGETPVAGKISFFQHKLIWKWFYESDGAFFSDLKQGDTHQLIQAASEMVSQEYADDIVIRPIAGRNAVLIRFPEPESTGNCYFSILENNQGEFSFYTYEKSTGLGMKPVVGMVGGWDSKGMHHNYGTRNYRNEEDFIDDVFNVLRESREVSR